ncbi:uncharacterized protein E0L32_004036 [Thyridium curvatum]|uniref:alpha-L-rhamnosidase n=1 Tax=Thyridium curvatum TaxID=1093900 RepID=A0A507B962_9PEZI|nr:uncharacterized protein E0L32_004036 [Thyridium curvatum]TPX16387.1 hypothetical protein E0L32_004036 [Thyridium curvatum]
MADVTHPELTKPVFEHHPDGFGISNPRPRLSWKFLASAEPTRGWTQAAYEVEILRHGDQEAQTFLVDSEESVLVPWPAAALRSRQQASVRVRCWGQSPDEHGTVRRNPEPTSWSPVASLEVALLEQSDWTASMITSSRRLGPEAPLQPLRFRRQFEIPSSVVTSSARARLYITALGVFEAFLNGERLGDECMAPGWTSYNHRLTYRCLDVTPHLRHHGNNVIAVEVAEGWYATKLGFNGGTRFLYGGKDIAVMAQLEITSGARSWTLTTDDNWACAVSAIQSSELYDGEVYDAREDHSLWTTAAQDADKMGTRWLRVKTLPQVPGRKLLTTSSPPVRVIESRQVQAIHKTPAGKTIVDFGQNLAGKVVVKSVTLAAGERLVLRHAEVLEHGELCTRPLKDAKCEDVIIGSGEEICNWTPKFTFHGFRYVQVDGWPGSEDELRSALSASVMHSDMQRRGYFSCSNEWVNKLHTNVVWSMRGNFLSVPTDCPQRDERLGWTGDIQIFCPTASYLYDTVGFLENWLEDLSSEQLEQGNNGVPPFVSPEVPLLTWPRRKPQAVWHDVTVLTPWDLHRFSSDKVLLERQFQSMRAWLEQGVDRGEDGLWNFYLWQLGDWLDPNAPPQNPALALTDKVLVADAYLVHTTEVFAQVCALLGKAELATKYRAEASTLKRLFQDKYLTPSGNIMSNTQTAIALALQFGLYRGPAQRRTASRALSKLVRTAFFHVSTGFAGTPAVLPALAGPARQPQLAYRMLLEKACPSWLYPVTMGATTTWERWDSMLPDGSVNPGRMTSFNHYALGAAADWLHGCVGGLAPLGAGWRVALVRPVPGGNLTHAEARFDGPYGLLRCAWRVTASPAAASSAAAGEAARFEMELEVPPNSSAKVILPCDWITDPGDEAEEAFTLVGSGVHHFACDFVAGEWPPKALPPPNMPYSPEMDMVAE